MSKTLQDRFPDLYFDMKDVVEMTPKKVPPSIGQVFGKILVAHGINDSGLASDLAEAATDYFAAPAKP